MKTRSQGVPKVDLLPVVCSIDLGHWDIGQVGKLDLKFSLAIVDRG